MTRFEDTGFRLVEKYFWVDEAGMFSFSPRAEQVLALARKEAGRLHHDYVGTGHLLPGILVLGKGTAVECSSEKWD